MVLKLKNFLIVGLDGAGKTTHARKLMEELAMRGIRTRYVYMRGYGRVFVAFPFLVLSRLLGFTRVHVFEDENRVSEYRFFANKAFQILWPWVSLIDSMLYSFIVFSVYSLLSDRLTICDRGVIDTLVDIIADTQDQLSLNRYDQHFLNLIPKNSVVALLDVDENTALQRKKDVICLRYLKIRRNVYRRLAERYSWPIINTEAEFDTVHRELLRVCDLNDRSYIESGIR